MLSKSSKSTATSMFKSAHIMVQLLSLLQLTVWLFVADASPALQAEVKSMQSRMGVLELENKTIQTQLNQSLHTSQKERDIGEASSRRPSWLSLLRPFEPCNFC